MPPQNSNNLVEFSLVNFEEFRKELQYWPRALLLARRQGLRVSAKFLAGQTEEHIDSFGGGSWSKLAQMRVRRRKRGSFYLSNFVNWDVEKPYKKGTVLVGDPDSRSALGLFLQQQTRIHEYGQTQDVKDSQRGLFGAQRRRPDDVPGRDFFPLKASTKKLKTPKRPIFGPVYRANRSKAFKKFVAEYERILEKKGLTE